MKVAYYRLEIQYRERKLYIWIDSERGNEFVISEGGLLSFQNDEELAAYCDEQHISLINEMTSFNIPSKEYLLFLRNDRNKLTDFCKLLLNEWNLAEDILNSFGKSNPYLSGLHTLYDKVFYGNNLPLEDDQECEYVPHFSKRERQQIRDLINEIYDIFDKKL